LYNNYLTIQKPACFYRFNVYFCDMIQTVSYLKSLSIGFWSLWASYLVLTSLSMSSCASTGELLAGPKDTTPPKLDSLKSTPNYQTLFTKQDVVFFFDEYVELKDVFKQILVSPPLVYLPKVTNRGKKVTFSFHKDEVLRPDVTYTVNFGEAIVDFREGNKLTNFHFIFSTGEVLDSLSVTGAVYDAQTLQPLENVQILLYDRFYDSIVVKEKPYYTVKTDKSGKFICRNIKADTFKILALVDNNVNLKFDLETEKIAFLDSLVIISDSMPNTPFSFYVSTPHPRSKLLSKNLKTYGLAELIFNKIPDITDIQSLNPDIRLYEEIMGDSLLIYFENPQDSFRIKINEDTILIKKLPPENKTKLPAFAIRNTNFSKNLLSSDSLSIQFSAPVTEADLTKIIISDTLGEMGNWQHTWSKNRKTMYIYGKWRLDMPYNISLDSAAFRDIYGRVTDSVGYAFQFLLPNKTAGLNMIFENFDSLHHYQVYLMKGNQKISSFSFSNTVNYNKEIKMVVPDQYTLEIIQDDNQNGKWDPADYWSKKQPEKRQTYQSEKPDVNRVNDWKISWKKETPIPGQLNIKK
jgi:hypothetical protein